MVSTYKSTLDSNYSFDPTFKVDKNSVGEVMAGPFQLQYFATPEPYLRTGAALGAGILATHLHRMTGISFSPDTNQARINEMLKGVRRGTVLQYLFFAAGISYMAGVGEEMFYRGTLMPRFEEYLVINNLKKISPDLSNCIDFDFSEVKKRIAELPPHKQEELLVASNKWANAIQAILFAGAHGKIINLPHLMGGAAYGELYSDDGYNLSEAAFAHAWYNFVVFSITILKLTM